MSLATVRYKFRGIQNYYTSINVLYTVISLVLLLIGNYVRELTFPFSSGVILGLIICSVVILLIAIYGFYIGNHHNHVSIVFYIVFLSFALLAQLAVATACIFHTTTSELNEEVKYHWKNSDENQIFKFENRFDCCGLTSTMDSAVNCTLLKCSKNKDCDPCINVISIKILEGLIIAGSVGIVTSIFYFIGIYAAIKYKQAIDGYWEDHLMISEESDSELYYE
uniref:Tetraspanin 97E (inferred by orthology to a D. melanogaster protein) n=2 Tax=Strongyloides TaxID=6247 RepID=A0A0K0F2S5_STRVS